jgi:hypothetical protein
MNTYYILYKTNRLLDKEVALVKAKSKKEAIAIYCKESKKDTANYTAKLKQS